MSERIAYKSEQPDFVTPPGDTLQEMLEERGMSQTELGQRIGRPLKTINGIIKGHKAITAETALQFEKAFGVPARFWLAREQDYREFLARQAENKALQAHQAWVDRFPIAKMQTLGWLPQITDRAQLLVALLQFFGIAHPDSWEDIWHGCLVNYRKTPAFASDDYALSVWLRQAEIEAQEIYIAPYDEAAFRKLLVEKIRPLTCQTPEQFYPQLVALCAAVGVAVVALPQVDGARVSGAARWLAKDKALIQLSFALQNQRPFLVFLFPRGGSHHQTWQKETLHYP